jgi:hypothetical protein
MDGMAQLLPERTISAIRCKRAIMGLPSNALTARGLPRRWAPEEDEKVHQFVLHNPARGVNASARRLQAQFPEKSLKALQVRCSKWKGELFTEPSVGRDEESKASEDDAAAIDGGYDDEGVDDSPVASDSAEADAFSDEAEEAPPLPQATDDSASPEAAEFGEDWGQPRQRRFFEPAVENTGPWSAEEDAVLLYIDQEVQADTRTEKERLLDVVRQPVQGQFRSHGGQTWAQMSVSDFNGTSPLTLRHRASRARQDALSGRVPQRPRGSPRWSAEEGAALRRWIRKHPERRPDAGLLALLPKRTEEAVKKAWMRQRRA